MSSTPSRGGGLVIERAAESKTTWARPSFHRVATAWAIAVLSAAVMLPPCVGAGERKSANPAEGETATLVMSVSPEGAGTTEPSGTTSQSLETEIAISAAAASGWSFVKWEVVSGEVEFNYQDSSETTICLYSDASITATFTPCETVTLAIAADPPEGGTVSPASSTKRNVGDEIEIIATPASDQYIFSSWVYPSGVEIMDEFSAESVIRLSEDITGETITVTARFLKLESAAGAVSFTASFSENPGKNGRKSVMNKASVTAKLNVDLTGLEIDENTLLSIEFGDGMASSEFPLGDDPKLKVTGAGGSAKFVETDEEMGKKIGSAAMKWDAKGLVVTYALTPPADFNILDLRSFVCEAGVGAVSINSSAAEPLSMSISIEGTNWSHLWRSQGNGLAYAGKGVGKSGGQVGGDYAKWEVKGSGAVDGYSGYFTATTAKRKSAAGNGSRLRRHSPAAGRTLGGMAPTSVYKGYIYPHEVEMILPGFIQAPFLYKNKDGKDMIYAVSRGRMGNLGKAIFTTGSVDSDGKYSAARNFTMPIAPGERFTSCVFRGVAYLFNDRHISGDDFKILFHKSGTPDVAWIPGAYEGDDTGCRGKYLRGGLSKTGLKALVFNDMLYLFYWKDGAIEFSTSTDGATWTAAGTVKALGGDKFRAQFSACAVTRYGRPAICLAIAGSDKVTGMIQFAFVYGDNTWEIADNYKEHMWFVQPENCISISSGSVKDSIQGQTIQIFGQHGHWLPWHNHMRHLTMDVESGKNQGWESLLDVQTGERYKIITPCDTIEVPVKVPGTSDIRQYILMFDMTDSGLFWEGYAVASYQSNYYRSDGTQEVDTGNDATVDRDSWLLLGVVDGVPPFTRNGGKDSSSLSEIEYGRSSTEAVTTDLSFECAVLAGVGVSKKDVIDAGVSVKGIFAASTGFTNTVKGNMSNTFKSIGDNSNGKKGLLFYGKPKIKSEKFFAYSQNKMVKLGEYNLVYISEMTFAPELYDLSSPPKGMRVARESTNLEWWSDSTDKGRGPLESYPALTRLTKGLTMTVNGSTEAKCALSKDMKSTTKISTTTTIEAKSKIGALLKIEGGASFTFKFATSYETTFSEYVNAKLSAIPKPSSDYAAPYTSFTVQPAWYICDNGTLLKDITPSMPYWVPENNRKQGLVPWCVTWQVTSKTKE